MAKARNTDPATSHAAAASVQDITKTQAYILRALGRPRTDSEMIDAYRKYKTAPTASESGLRTRREELARLNLVTVVGEKPLPSGRMGRVWKIVEGIR
jgi:hypothetical protein